MRSATHGLSLLTMWSVERTPCSVSVIGNGLALSAVGYLKLEEEGFVLRWGYKGSLRVQITPDVEFEVNEEQDSTALEFNLKPSEPENAIKVTVMHAQVSAAASVQ